jgi:hypothetical protein
LKPGQLFTIRLLVSEHAEREVAFRCHVADRVIVEGRLQVRYGSN